MVILRVVHDIKAHFPARRSEWVLAGMMMAWGAIVIAPGDTFAQSAAWAQMAALFDEKTWGSLAIALGAARFVALIINGTFSHTWYGRYSPHVRWIASFLSCFLWLQISIGLLSSGAATTALAVYPGLLVLDFLNILAAASDAGGLDGTKTNAATRSVQHYG